MALEGDVATFPVRDLVGWLARSRATGTLSLARGMSARRIHLHDGDVVMASSSDEDLLMGHLLVERGIISHERLTEALAARGRSRARLGRLLTRGGLVPVEALRDVLAEKARRLLLDAFTWQQGTFRFEPATPPRQRSGVKLALPLATVLEEGDREIAVTDADVLDVRDVN